MASELFSSVSPWLFSVGVLLCATLVVLAWVSFRKTRRDLRARLLRQDEVIASLRQDLRALTSAAVGVGGRVLDVERRQRRLAERQDQLDLYDSANQPYEQAIRLVHKGADVDELVDICGLNRGEAELIRMLHRLDKSA